jgi:molybdopterin synthase sulfur carrier subunit
LERRHLAGNAAGTAAARVGAMKLLYFAWLRARIGHAEEQTTLPQHVRDVAGLLDWLRGRGPAYAEALRDLSVVRVAVNQDYVGSDHPISDGDEVAIFPPVTGG